jgi:hypothetical protein
MRLSSHVGRRSGHPAVMAVEEKIGVVTDYLDGIGVASRSSGCATGGETEAGRTRGCHVAVT